MYIYMYLNVIEFIRIINIIYFHNLIYIILNKQTRKKMNTFRNREDSRNSIILTLDKYSGKSNYETWNMGRKMSFIKAFQDNADILEDRTKREKWVSKIFMANHKKENGGIRKFTILSPGKTPGRDGYDSTYQTPRKGTMEEQIDGLRKDAVKDMIREACNIIAASISDNITTQLCMGIESPWEKAIKANDYDMLIKIIKTAYAPQMKYPHQRMAELMQQMNNMKCEDMNLIIYHDIQVTDYYEIAAIHNDTETWRNMEGLEHWMINLIIATILGGCTHPIVKDIVQKTYAEDKIPKNMLELRAYMMKIQEDYKVNTPHPKERSHLTKPENKRKRESHEQESEMIQDSQYHQNNNNMDHRRPVYIEQPQKRRMCMIYWRNKVGMGPRCDDATCSNSHEEKDRIYCKTLAAGRKCKFGTTCAFSHIMPAKKNVPTNAPGGNKNAAKNTSTRERNRMTTQEGYSPGVTDDYDEQNEQYIEECESKQYVLRGSHVQHMEALHLTNEHEDSQDEASEEEDESEQPQYQRA